MLDVSLVAAAGGYGDSIVNVAGFQTDSLVTDVVNRVQYLVRQTQAKKIVVSKRTLDSGLSPSGSWTHDQSDIAFTTATDSHNCISMAVDASGRLHVSGDMHGAAMNYWRAGSAGAIHIADWFTAPIVAGEGAIEASVTYPVFVRLSNGNLLWFFRTGGSGDGNLVMRRWSDAANGGGDTWATLYANLVDGSGSGMSAYVNRIAYKNGKLGIAWCWRDSPSLNTNHDLMYMYALESEGFSSWYQADGTPQTVPVTPANAGYVEIVSTNTGRENVGGLDFDDSGKPILTVNHDPGDGFTQHKLWFWDGSAWVARWPAVLAGVPNQKPYSYVGLASAPTHFILSPLAHVLHRSGRTILLTKQDSYNNSGPVALVCDEPTYSNWTPIPLSAIDLQDWESNIDIARFRADGEVWSIHQRATIDAPPNAIGAQDVSLLRWRPANDIPYVAPAAPWDPSGIPNCIDYIEARHGSARVRGTVGSNQNNLNALENILTGSERYIQETSSDTPTYVWNAVNGRAAVLFTAATSDFMLTSDSALFSQLNVVNGPLSFILAVCPLTLAVNSTFRGFGGASTHLLFWSCGSVDPSKLAWGRRTGGTLSLLESASGALVVGQWAVFSGIFDGSGAGILRKNGVTLATTGTLVTSGALNVNTGSLGCRRTTGNSLYNNHYLASSGLWNRAVSLAELQSAEAPVMAQVGLAA